MRETLAPEVHDRGEYFRVEEIAARFGVSVDDVLAACSILGFPAHDAHSLIDIVSFTTAVNAAPSVRADDNRRRALRRLLVTTTAVAASLLVVLLGYTLAPRDHTRAPAPQAVSYRAQLKSTFDATVGRNPNGSGFRSLADELEHITPPPALRAEHAALVAEAEHVAALTAPEAPVTSSVDATTEAAVDALRQHVAELDRSLPAGAP